MDITQFEYFTVVAKLEHMSRAAERLNISQPALSLKIKNLEEELGAELFTRNGRSIELNDNGRLFLSVIQPILEKLNSVKLFFASHASDTPAKINFAGPPFSTYPGLIDLIGQAIPNIPLHKTYISPSEFANALDDGSIDFCFTAWTVSGKNICSLPLLSDDLILYISKAHPLATRMMVSIAELKDYSLSAFSPQSSSGIDINALCLSYGFKPKITFIGNTPGEVIDRARSGEHVALLPRILFKFHCKDPNMIGIPISEPHICPPLRLYWHFSTSENELLRVVRQTFIDYFKNIKY